MTDTKKNLNAFNLGVWEQCSNLIRTKITSDDKRGFLIAECPANMPGAMECARLISCAPEILDALIDMLGWQSFAPDDVISRAKAVVAKATGEQA